MDNWAKERKRNPSAPKEVIEIRTRMPKQGSAEKSILEKIEIDTFHTTRTGNAGRDTAVATKEEKDRGYTVNNVSARRVI